MTHGYEWLFEYDMIDLDDYYIDIFDFEDFDMDEDIEDFWSEIKGYEEFEDDYEEF